VKFFPGLVVFLKDKSFSREIYKAIGELSAKAYSALKSGSLVFIWGNVVDETLPSNSLVLVKITAKVSYKGSKSLLYECGDIHGKLSLGEFGCEGDPYGIVSERNLLFLIQAHPEKFSLPKGMEEDGIQTAGTANLVFA
jgi:hypothetical protein